MGLKTLRCHSFIYPEYKPGQVINSKPEEQIGNVVKSTLVQLSYEEIVSLMEQHMLDLRLIKKVDLMQSKQCRTVKKSLFFQTLLNHFMGDKSVKGRLEEQTTL